MDNRNLDPSEITFQSRPGGRSGCGCCGFWFSGMMALVISAVVALVVII